MSLISFSNYLQNVSLIPSLSTC